MSGQEVLLLGMLRPVAVRVEVGRRILGGEQRLTYKGQVAAQRGLDKILQGGQFTFNFEGGSNERDHDVDLKPFGEFLNAHVGRDLDVYRSNTPP